MPRTFAMSGRPIPGRRAAVTPEDARPGTDRGAAAGTGGVRAQR